MINSSANRQTTKTSYITCGNLDKFSNEESAFSSSSFLYVSATHKLLYAIASYEYIPQNYDQAKTKAYIGGLQKAI